VWQELRSALDTPKPSKFFEVLRDCGALARLFPEIDRLFGVPQPPEHHPEIDTGLHTLMVLDQAARLDTATPSRFAALCHDLGKGTTPAEHLPRHIGHQERGVKMIEDLCRRHRIPKAYRDLAVLTARFHTKAHTVAALKPKTLLDLLARLDSLRRAERFEQFLTACEADYRGRKGFEEREYPQADYLRAARAAVMVVDAGALARQGLKGEQLAQELTTLRLRKLRALKETRASG
jgi:tRNA nucleotidyltransferase (CCA-adding enzyme)